MVHYKEMITRDERRFKQADTDSDGKLSREQFASFLHPESDDNMKPLVVQETLEDIDKDKDGSISIDEYIGTNVFFLYLLYWLLLFIIIVLCFDQLQ